MNWQAFPAKANQKLLLFIKVNQNLPKRIRW